MALAGGRVMVLGGMDHRQTALATVEVYHPDEGRWERRAPLGQPSMGVTALEKGGWKRVLLWTVVGSIVLLEPLITGTVSEA